MDYKAMAKAIRAERRGIWEALGKPVVTAWRYKPRQSGCESYMAERMMRQALGFEHVPWRDLLMEDYWRKSTEAFLQGLGYSVDWKGRDKYIKIYRDTKTNGILHQMTNIR